MQDSNNINLFNNYSIFYSHNNQLDKEYNSNQINSVFFDREGGGHGVKTEIFDNSSKSDYYLSMLTFSYHKSSYDAFNIDRKRINILSNGIIQTTQ